MKKWAKIFLVRLMAFGATPDFIKVHACDLLGIEYQSSRDPEKAIFAARFMNGCRGALCISIDFDNRDDRRRSISEAATIQLIELFEEFGIPATWAICGVTALAEKGAFRRIVDSKASHELAVHTYDHADFSSPDLSNDLAAAQIEKTIQLLPRITKPKTFIFPWNREGHFDLLVNQGFIAFRGRKRRLSYPSKKHELWDIHPVFYLSERNYDQADVLGAFLDLTIACGSIFHLWFHPWNLDTDGNVKEFMSRTLRPFLECVHRRMMSGELWACTLADLANYCELRSNLSISGIEEQTGSISAKLECPIRDARFERGKSLAIALRAPGRAELSGISVDGQNIEDTEVIKTRSHQNGRIFFVRVSFDKPVKYLIAEFGPGRIDDPSDVST